MFIHFENWANYMGGIDARIPNQGTAIKAYATFSDPRDFFQNPALAVVEVNHEPFTIDEMFNYGDQREGYSGIGLESDLSRAHEMSLRFQPEIPLDDIAKKTVRAMMRLSHSSEFPAATNAMLAKDIDGTWYFNHPFSLFHGFEKLAPRKGRNMAIHFDILSPDSLELLSRVFDWNDASKLVPIREGKKIREADLARIFQEGNPKGKEF